MPSDRIALVGFMASGKSTVGPALAMRLGMEFLDLDEAIEHVAGRRIHEIFAEDGEAAFRDLESQVLRESLAGPSSLVSTGGGVVESRANRELLVSRTQVVWLDTRFETLRRRLGSGKSRARRPLVDSLGWEGLRALHRRRRPLYAACAHYRFDTDRDIPVRVARRIEGALRAAEETRA